MKVSLYINDEGNCCILLSGTCRSSQGEIRDLDITQEQFVNLFSDSQTPKVIEQRLKKLYENSVQSQEHLVSGH